MIPIVIHMKLVIINLSKTYKNGVKAIDHLNLEIGTGMFGLLGPNGAGKSTLMRTIATLQSPDSGSIMFGEINMLEDNTSSRKKLGWHARSGHGTKIVWHNCGTHGYRSFIGMEHKRAVVVPSNSFNDPVDIGFHLMNSAYPLKESPSSKEVIAVDPVILSEHTGEYEFAPQAILTITKSGETLSAQLPGQPAFPILA